VKDFFFKIAILFSYCVHFINYCCYSVQTKTAGRRTENFSVLHRTYQAVYGSLMRWASTLQLSQDCTL